MGAGPIFNSDDWRRRLRSLRLSLRRISPSDRCFGPTEVPDSGSREGSGRAVCEFDSVWSSNPVAENCGFCDAMPWALVVTTTGGQVGGMTIVKDVPSW